MPRDGGGEQREGQERARRDIVPALAGKADNQPRKARGEEQQRQREDVRKAAGRGAGGGDVLHAAAPAAAPLAISSMRRSIRPGSDRSHSITPVHSTQIVARSSSAQSTFSGSPP